jgi:hypothetical protein
MLVDTFIYIAMEPPADWCNAYLARAIPCIYCSTVARLIDSAPCRSIMVGLPGMVPFDYVTHMRLC